MNTNTTIHWFRQDLRLADNPALSAAAERGRVVPVFILDTNQISQANLGSASRWWLHYSLQSLNRSLKGALNVYQGDPLEILTNLVHRFDADAICWNRCYEPWSIERDCVIKSSLSRHAEIQSYNGSLLWEPWTISKQDGNPYKVFSAYYRKGCLAAPEPAEPLPAPLHIECIKDKANQLSLDELSLLPKIRWDKKLETRWQIGEQSAAQRLHQFVDHSMSTYKDTRDFPSGHTTSRLSPHLHFGEISARQIWTTSKQSGEDTNLDKFLSELVWREFSCYLLYHFADLPHNNFQNKFDRFPWRDNNDPKFQAWTKGQTGYPLVDAGMRELWNTGFMHNRVRMVAASFLVKNLMIHWRHGKDWFNDCLVDADLASNSASWQWVAGSGADAAPYFRIFNPTTQGQKFDPDGMYTRSHIPELSQLPNRYLFTPWQAPDTVLQDCGLKSGIDYPKPVVDLSVTRQRALAAFRQLNTQEARRA